MLNKYIEEVMQKINDPEIVVVAQTAPAIRVSLGEEFGLPIGTNVRGKMITALRKIGFDKVFDTNTGADFTITEEAAELVDRIENNKVLPMITSCCPAWVKFAEMQYPDLLDHLSTCKSPHQMLGAVLHSYYAEKMNIDTKKLFVVSIMPCVVKRHEALRKEMIVDGVRDVDAVITTREFAQMIREKNIDFLNLEDSDFDMPIGEATGGGAIFGTTGGVMESALRAAYNIMTNKKLEKIEFHEVRGLAGIRRATIDMSGRKIKVVIVSGLANVKPILEEIRQGKADYQFVEIMSCSGGCIGGAAQPIVSKEVSKKCDVRKLRSQALYEIDKNSKVKIANENPNLKKIYDEYIGKPNGKMAKKLLHTKYTKNNK